jgi:thiol-disulfide isomerase/thioredoxin
VKRPEKIIAAVAAVLGFFLVLKAAPFITEMLVGHPRTENLLPAPPESSLEASRALGNMPSDWMLTGLDGQELSFSSFHGKVVFVNVWATWCGPCVMEMPTILKLRETLPRDQVEFVLLSTDKLETMRTFLGDKGWAGPFYVPSQSLPASLTTNAIPATFVVNKRGQIVVQETGAADWSSAGVKRLLEKLAREPI